MKNDDVPALIESAKFALRAARHPEAEALCQRILAVDPGNPMALYTIASLAASHGRAATAIQYLRELVTRDPLAWEPQEFLCRLLLQVGEIAEAIQFGQRASELQPAAHQAHCTLGACYIEEGRFSEAHASLNRAMTLQTAHMPTHHYLGVVLRRLGCDVEAEAEFRQATLLDPGAPEPLVQLAKLLRDQARNEEAASCLEQAIATPGQNPRGCIGLASSLMAIGLHAEVEAPLRIVLRNDPDNVEALGHLGRLLHQTGHFPEAIECFEKLLYLDSDSAQAYFDLVQCRKTVNTDGPMIQTMSAMLDQPRLSAAEARHLHYALGKAHDDLTEYPEAFRHYKAANEITDRTISGRRLSDDEKRAGIEQIMRTFTPEFLASNREIGSESETPILIVGMIRSGTTLVEQILSGHTAVAAGGEQKFLYEHADLQLRSKGEIATRAPGVRDAYLRLLQSIGRGERFVTDKMPLNFETLGLFHLMFPNGRIIHCRRNPADTCLSIYTAPFAKPAEIGHDPDVIAAYYRQYQFMMERWQEALPDKRIHHIDYEHLVSNRDVEVRQLLEFCELDWDEACLHHESRFGAVATPSTWQVRQPIYTSSVGRWRNYETWLPQFGRLNAAPTTPRSGGVTLQ